MSLKQAVEDHIVLFFLGTLAVGFVSGWGAYSAIQLATGHTSVSVDRLKQLEGPEALEKKVLQDKVQELEHERTNLMRQLGVNRPLTGNYVRNVSLTPPSPADIRVGSEIGVKFAYVLTEGEEASIFVIGDGPMEYHASGPTSGSGTDEKTINCFRAGKVTEIRISMQSSDGHDLYEMKLPVDYTCK